SSFRDRDFSRNDDKGKGKGKDGKDRPEWDPRNARNPDLDAEKTGGRERRGSWYSDHDDRQGEPEQRRRASSPDCWKHDMFGKEAEPLSTAPLTAMFSQKGEEAPAEDGKKDSAEKKDERAKKEEDSASDSDSE
ncbi:unnamed protein product, partial [Polarella glacialis]